MKKFSLLLIFMSLQFSCSNENNIEKKNELSKEEIKEVIRIVEDNKKWKEKEYYHLKNDLMYNDSTHIVTLVKNKQLPIVKDGLSNFIEYNGTYIYTYNLGKKISQNDLNYLKSNNLLSSNSISPFFIVDTKYCNLLIKKGKEGLVIKEMNLLFEKVNGKSDEDELIDF